jgi:hypothetical protein
MEGTMDNDVQDGKPPFEENGAISGGFGGAENSC